MNIAADSIHFSISALLPLRALLHVWQMPSLTPGTTLTNWFPFHNPCFPPAITLAFPRPQVLHSSPITLVLGFPTSSHLPIGTPQNPHSQPGSLDLIPQTPNPTPDPSLPPPTPPPSLPAPGPQPLSYRPNARNPSMVALSIAPGASEENLSSRRLT